MSDNEETVRVRIAAGFHRQDGVSHPAGTELTVRKAVYEAFPNKFEPIAVSEVATSESDTSGDDDATSETDDDAAFDAAGFVDRTPQSDVITDIESGEYDSHLDAIKAAETEGKDRNGVTDAIDARRN